MERSENMSNWSLILSSCSASNTEPFKYVLGQISTFELTCMTGDQYELMQMLVAELRKLLEEYLRYTNLDERTRMAIIAEIHGIRSGGPNFWWHMFAAIKNLLANVAFDGRSQDFGLGFTPSSPQQYPSIYNYGKMDFNHSNDGAYVGGQGRIEQVVTDVITTPDMNNGGNSTVGAGFQSMPAIADNSSQHGEFLNFYSTEHLAVSPQCTSSSPQLAVPLSERSIDCSPIQETYIPMSVQSPQNLTPIVPSNFLAASPHLRNVEQEMKEALGDVKQWILEAENKERDIGSLTHLDNMFLDGVETKCGRVIKQLLSFQTPESLRMLEIFVSNLLVIVKQPDRIIQYKERFSTTVRLLIPKSMLLLSSKNNTVGITLLNEEGRQPLDKPFTGVAEAKLETTTGCNGLFALLSPQIPKNPKRLNKANNPDMLRVHDEAFFLQISTTVRIQGYSKPITVSAVAHPIRITVNSKQDLNAWETVIWDNAAGQFGVVPCRNRPSALPRMTLFKAINAYFHDTGHSLKKRDYDVIYSILFPGNKLSKDDNAVISLSEFRVEQEIRGFNLDLKESRRISFWGWCFYLRKFINSHLRQYWHNDDLIVGYMTQEESRAKLTTEGDFIIRFSNSTPNAVTVEWNDPGTGGFPGGIYSYRGSVSDLTLRSLKERVLDTSRWKTHYPTRLSKDMLFHDEQMESWDDDEVDSTGTKRNGSGGLGYVRSLIKSSLDFS